MLYFIFVEQLGGTLKTDIENGRRILFSRVSVVPLYRDSMPSPYKRFGLLVGFEVTGTQVSGEF
jgi:hypothetical protein